MKLEARIQILRDVYGDPFKTAVAEDKLRCILEKENELRIRKSVDKK